MIIKADERRRFRPRSPLFSFRSDNWYSALARAGFHRDLRRAQFHFALRCVASLSRIRSDPMESNQIGLGRIGSNRIGSDRLGQPWRQSEHDYLMKSRGVQVHVAAGISCRFELVPLNRRERISLAGAMRHRKILSARGGTCLINRALINDTSHTAYAARTDPWRIWPTSAACVINFRDSLTRILAERYRDLTSANYSKT